MAENPRRLPGWIGNQSVSSSTSVRSDNARSSASDNEEVRVGGSDCSNGAHDLPSSSGTTCSVVSQPVGPLCFAYDYEDVVDSCRSSNVDNVSSDGDRQIVSGTSDRIAGECKDELVDSTSDGAPADPNAPDSSHDVSGPDNNLGEVDSSGINSNLDQVSSAQPSHSRDSCFYGSSCYRRNPQHRQEYSHPGDADYVEPSSNAPSVKPICKYGQGCFRRNPKHRQYYNHDIAPLPRAARPTSFNDGDRSSDEDEFDSGSSEEFSPGDSDTDDSFLVSDSHDSGSDNQPPNKDNATNGNDRPGRKKSKRRRNDGNRASKRTKN